MNGTAAKRSGPALALALTLALAGCGGRPPRPGAEPASPAPPVAAPTPQAPAKPMPPPRRGGGYYQDDGPGDQTPPDLATIPDAVPRAEPLHRFANRPYSVLGREYTPLPSVRPYRERGIASWYGRKFHGQKTSSGEIYDMYGMTAAHPTLPIPSYARIVNPANGRSVVVRINDRGPFHSGRLIDLSYTAAWKLDYVNSGSTLVEVTSLIPGEPIPAGTEGDDPIARFADPPAAVAAATLAAADPATGGDAGGDRFLQLGAFGNPDNAESFRAHITRELDWLAGRVRIAASGNLYRVQAGPFANRREAEATAERIRQALGMRPLLATRGG